MPYSPLNNSQMWKNHSSCLWPSDLQHYNYCDITCRVWLVSDFLLLLLRVLFILYICNQFFILHDIPCINSLLQWGAEWRLSLLSEFSEQGLIRYLCFIKLVFLQSLLKASAILVLINLWPRNSHITTLPFKQDWKT